MATTAQKKTDQILNSSNALLQRNTLNTLLNRAIKFRKSRYVDEKLELFKRKYAPINTTDRKIQSEFANDPDTDQLELVDANGFERPEKMLFSKDKLNVNWSSIRAVGAGLTDDLGRMSALNAVLQVLTYTPIFANYLFARYHGNNCIMQDYCFVCALEEHVSQCFKQNIGAVSPRYFVGQLKQMESQTSSNAYMVWEYMMKQIQKSLLSEKSSPDKRIQETTALHQMFGGYMQDKYVCDACKKEANTYEPFLNITGDITKSNTMEKCLSQRLKEHQANLHLCPSCESESSGRRKLSMYRTPKVLTIHLNRLEHGKKNDKNVKFSETFDIQRYISETEKENVEHIYHLNAIIVHQGTSLLGGHHVAYVKAPNGQWHCFDGDSVQQASVKRVLDQKPHMLFYTAEPLKKQQKSKQQQQTKSKKQITKGLKATKFVAEPFERQAEEQEVIAPETVDNSVISVGENGEKKEEEDEYADDKEDDGVDTVVARPVADNPRAVIVSHDDKMDTKRSKLDALIELEESSGSSAQAKQILLSKSQHPQFSENVARWDEEDTGSVVNEKERLKALKKTKAKRKRLDAYDQEYDRGKIKKVKKKTTEKFNQPNVFQMAAEQMQKK
ncbi:hypothetical protein BDB00DRAFT_801508 [Zychaea mexicana]|uniref:uncharacterized protein n=1 Tax=Zychaea mexicana TaxID=64656 RepID=UPI0022FE8F1B|nr:uncharacterized protein BDB00DRAFT_801508 [Zychaea mexicana]KAI9498185.1 hypothetical protein BDB00DRAFT_801508 [Zychaea mexicana]